ncbi:hypothetical protein SLEP1_g57325 [Rubroshorea leprosula]|uniref:Uncharacterized protein n=1 Tax=Rubroshorea leprosula TaxID=152421 RepID=A0AAV5MM44_9ROSI|nr:hypothetical protein SLEP1_g57325 [Rubroshorea leprosula]
MECSGPYGLAAVAGEEDDESDSSVLKISERGRGHVVGLVTKHLVWDISNVVVDLILPPSYRLTAHGGLT